MKGVSDTTTVTVRLQILIHLILKASALKLCIIKVFKLKFIILNVLILNCSLVLKMWTYKIHDFSTFNSWLHYPFLSFQCERYQTLINEIESRTGIGSFLCVEVLLCSDCPCGLLKTTCKDPLFPMSSKSPWQSSSEMLLEYWCIGNISSK